MSETLEALKRRIAECERQDAEITTLKARINEQAERIASLNDRLADAQMLAHRWMKAHDARVAGISYDLPKPADLPERIASLEADLKTNRECRQVQEASLLHALDAYEKQVCSLEAERDQVLFRLGCGTAAREAAESRLSAVREALEDAPHEEDCDYILSICHTPRLRVKECSCWKRRALALLDAEPQYAIGEFGFPIEGPEWECACEEGLNQLSELVDQIKQGVPLPPPSPEIASLIDRVLSNRAEPQAKQHAVESCGPDSMLHVGGCGHVKEPQPKGQRMDLACIHCGRKGYQHWRRSSGKVFCTTAPDSLMYEAGAEPQKEKKDGE